METRIIYEYFVFLISLKNCKYHSKILTFVGEQFSCRIYSVYLPMIVAVDDTSSSILGTASGLLDTESHIRELSGLLSSLSRLG